jgi:hypothetical protein
MEAIDRGETTACRLLYTFVVCGGDESQTTEHLPGDNSPISLTLRVAKNESEVEHDVVSLNIRENMNDGKTPTWFKYAAGLVDKYGIDYVGKGDSDTLLWFPHVLTVMERDLSPRPATASEDNRRIYAGWMVDKLICGFNVYCNRLQGKVYMSGQFFFVSSDLAKFSTDARIDRSIPVRHEDFDFGMRLLSHPLPIKLVPLTGYRIWRHDVGLKKASGWMSTWKKISKSGVAIKGETFWPTLK